MGIFWSHCVHLHAQRLSHEHSHLRTCTRLFPDSTTNSTTTNFFCGELLKSIRLGKSFLLSSKPRFPTRKVFQITKRNYHFGTLQVNASVQYNMTRVLDYVKPKTNSCKPNISLKRYDRQSSICTSRRIALVLHMHSYQIIV